MSRFKDLQMVSSWLKGYAETHTLTERDKRPDHLVCDSFLPNPPGRRIFDFFKDATT